MGNSMESQVNKLMATGNADDEQIRELLKFRNPETTEYLYEMARVIRHRTFGDTVNIWGRIPISSFCKYNCKMCGLRRENQFAKRYRMDINQILRYCHNFAEHGVESFLLEGGDDAFFSEMQMAEIILAIKKHHPNAKITLAIGEKGEKAYRHWFQIGVSGYILRHGSANELHFKKIYPSNMTLLLRKQSLWQLKQIGYNVGTGFLVGIPYQTIDNVLEDIRFMKDFSGNIIDIGAFVPALRTPFERERSGNGEMVLYIMAIMRLMSPNASIIAGQSLDCVLKEGRLRAFEAGADVLVADISDVEVLERYGVYERKDGRIPLPADHISDIRRELLGMGLRA